MAAVTSFVVLAIVAVSAVRSDQCGTTSLGDPYGKAVTLPKTVLKPGIADWEVTIPVTSACSQGAVYGVSAVVCDYDVLPNAHFVDFSLLIVHRVGDLQGYASVTATVYCKEAGWQTTDTPWYKHPWSSSQGLKSEPLWEDKKTVPVHPEKVWEQKPAGLIARPQ